MGAFRWSGPIHCKGGEKEKKKIYHIGIDVHKLRCVVAVKGESSPEVLRRTSFANDIDGITKFLEFLDKEDYLLARAACESTSTSHVLRALMPVDVVCWYCIWSGPFWGGMAAVLRIGGRICS